MPQIVVINTAQQLRLREKMRRNHDDCISTRNQNIAAPIRENGHNNRVSLVFSV